MELHIRALLLQTEDDLCFLTASQYSFNKSCLEILLLNNNTFSQLNCILSQEIDHVDIIQTLAAELLSRN